MQGPGPMPRGQVQLCFLLGGLGQPASWLATLSVVSASRGVWMNVPGTVPAGCDGASRVRTSHTVAGRGLTPKGPEPFCRTLFPWSAWGFPGGTAQGEVSLADTQCSLHRRLAPAASPSLPWGRRRREEGKGVRDQLLCTV